MPGRAWRRSPRAASRFSSSGVAVRRPPGSSCGAARAFVSALEAAEGRLWLREVIEDDPPGPRYRTQERWLGLGARLLGLGSSVGDRQAEQIAEELGLMGLEHRALRRRFEQASRLEARGQVIAEALSMLPLGRSL